MHRFIFCALVITITSLVGCGGRSQIPHVGDNSRIVPIESGSQVDLTVQYATEFPAALPQDNVQPWEELGSDGKVISATGASTEFLEGPQTHFESGNTTAWNGALRIASGGVGDGNLSLAMYRVPLGGSEPGVVSVDANLRPMGDGSIGGYWVGLADYGNGSWQWFGPVSDAHWRVSAVQAARSGASYLTGIGNVFVCVVAHDGATIDVVGVGVDPVDVADTTAPDAPTGLVLTPVAEGLELNWVPSGGSDVAGYKVYYNDSAFTELTAQFVVTMDTLEGRTFIVEAASQTWVAISAIDMSGNESAISTVESGTPLVGTAPQVTVEVTGYSAMRNDLVSLTANGADTYDWDTDGDGVFDIMGDASGTADVDTSQTGLIRPLVRGIGSGSTSVAMRAVSVIVSSNSRPVAFANVNLASGDAPHAVVFRGFVLGNESTDFDGEIVGGGWDFDGDGTFDDYSETEITYVASANHTYTTPGTYNAKLKVVDDEGAWDVDTVTVTVGTPADPANTPPVAALLADVTSGDAPLVVVFDASGSIDSDGTIVEYAWDWDGNGGFDESSTSPTMSHTFTTAGSPVVMVQVEDNDGAIHSTTIEVTVNVPGNTPPTAVINATPETGDSPLAVTLDAFGSNDPDGGIAIYEWDFDGDGTYNEAGEELDNRNEIAPSVQTYTVGPPVVVSVRVTDYDGATDTASVTITVVGWSAPQTLDSTGSVGWFTSLALVNGNPAISYHEGNNADLWYIRSTDASGSTWGTPIAVDTVGNAGNFTSLAVVDGFPAISYYVWGTSLKYARATNADGSSWGTPVTLDSTDDVGKHTSLAIVDGFPAVSYYDDTNDNLKYVRATSSSGSSWGTPQVIDTGGNVGEYTSLAIVDGNPAISYHDGTNGSLKYLRATDVSGSTWGTPLTIDNSGQWIGFCVSLAIVAGNPAISYIDANPSLLKYIRATDASGTNWGTPQTLGSAGSAGFYTSLAVVGGNPAICYFDNTGEDLMYVQATDANGTSWGTPLALDTAGTVGYFSSLLDLNGYPAISYQDFSNRDLKFVRLY